MRITGLIYADIISSRRQLDAARVSFFLAEYLLVIYLLSFDKGSFLNNSTLKSSLKISSLVYNHTKKKRLKAYF